MFVQKIHYGLHYIIQWFNSIPATSFYALGVFLASSGFVFWLTNLYKRHHFNKTQEALAKHYIALILVVLSAAMSYSDQIIIYGQAHPNFLGTWTPAMMGLAFAIYHLGGNKFYLKAVDMLSNVSGAAKQYNAETSVPAATAQPADQAVENVLI